MLLGISTGLFISAIFVFFFSALFSYTRETNLFAIILLTVSLLIFYIVETINQKDIEQIKPVGGKLLRIIFLIVAPLIFSIILIQGDIRSWVLVIISALLAWVLLK